MVRRSCVVLAVVAGLALAAAPARAADGYSVKTLEFDTKVGPDDDIDCLVVGDLYTPDGVSAAKPAPAVLTTNGFGGSKDDQADAAKALAKRGYVVLSYSGLGFGGSGCKITLDDRDYDGKAGSQLVTFLGGGMAARDGTRIDYVRKDKVGADGHEHAHDPRVGMVGGSYGGQIQFAIAGIDPRLDTIVPLITWNDLAYSLAPNNTLFHRGVTYQTPGVHKRIWTSLFFGVGIADGINGIGVDPSRNVGCPNFDDRACASKAQMDATGAPNDATILFARHASVTDFLDKIRIPTLLGQGQADTLFNLQEAVATYEALKARRVPVKMMWQSWGHSGGGVDGEFDLTFAKPTYQGTAILEWLDHYLKDDPHEPAHDFTFFREWVAYQGDATPAYGRAASYPIGRHEELKLSGDGSLQRSGAVTEGAATFTTPAAGAASSYTEISAVDPGNPVQDAPGTFTTFTTPPFDRDVEVVGVPRVTLRVSAPAHAFSGQGGAPGGLVLFVRLQKLGTDGTVTLPDKLISPVRIVTDTVPVEIELPGVVHRFEKGSRLQLVIAGGDLAYNGNNVSAPVQILTSPQKPGILRLPVVEAGRDYGAVVRATAPKASRRCTSRRLIRVSLKRRYARRVRSARVYVAGRRIATFARGRRSTVIDLRGRKAGAVKVRIVMRLRGGRTVTDTRSFRLCAKRAG